MRPYHQQIIVFAALALINAGFALGATPALFKHNPYLRIKAQPRTVIASFPVSLRLNLVNPSSLPLYFLPDVPVEDFVAAPSSRGPDGVLHLSRYGQSEIGRLRSATANPVVAYLFVKPRRSVKLHACFPFSRVYDLTMPGRYTFSLTTQEPLYFVSRKTTLYLRSGPATIGRHLLLAGFGDYVPDGSVAQAIARSNSCVVTVTAPYGTSPPSAIEPAPKRSLPGPLPPTARLVAKAIPAKGGGMPVLLRVWLYTGANPLSVSLTGNPLVDFRPTKVDGPDGRQGYGLVKTPKPHDGPLPNWKPVPLTAYGTWLTKHAPAKKLRAKTYVLKPHMVYQYTVPVNLSCRFDMTLPGNWGGSYHVRLQLAHSKLRTAWISVHVPPPADHLQP